MAIKRLIAVGLLLFACLRCVPAASTAEAVRLRTLSGQTLQGPLASISEHQVVIQADGKPVTVPLADVLEVEARPVPTQPPPGPFTAVELTDGSLLHCPSVAFKGQGLELKLSAGPSLRIPLAAVTYVLIDAHDGKVRDEWQTLLANRGRQDLLAIKDASGTVQPLKGTLGELDAASERIGFETASGTKTRVRLARVHGLSFFRQPSVGAAPVICKVSDTAGDMFAASRLTVAGDTVRVTTAAGAQVELPVSDLARIDFSRGKLTYLSSLEPVRVAESSVLGHFDHYRRDLNVNNDPLRLGRETYARGLALFATTELVYDIGGQYKEFRAVLGVDAGVGGDSNCHVLIEGDGSKLFAADVSRGKIALDGDPTDKPSPLPLTLNVTGVRQLRILVTPARPPFDEAAHVDLADAKVSK